MASIRDRISRDAEPWKPDEGDFVIGVVLDVQTREGEYGDYLLVTLETDDGREVEVHGFHTTLRNELMKLDPRVGDELAVRYLGKKTSATGASYYAYRVVIERGGDSPMVGTTPAVDAGPVGTPEMPDDPFPGADDEPGVS